MLNRLPPLLSAVLLIALASPAGAAAGCGAVKSSPAAFHPSYGRAPLVIGDSVLLGAIPQASRAGFEVNTKGCRQFSEALQILRARRRAHTLPYLVVIVLGTNGTISAGQWRTAMSILGPDRVLGIGTPRETGGVSGSDAAVARRFARAHRLRTQLVDWVGYTRGRAGWFAGDGIHLGHAGAEGLGRLLRRTRQAVVPPPCLD